MANEKFWFIFADKPTTKVFIDEPINFGDVDFQLNRKENGMALDNTISGGELKFRFTSHRNHYLEDILYLNHSKGFEADLKLGFSTESGHEYIGEVDFYTADTNDFDYFECSVILESEMQIFKRRSSTKVDMFSNKNTDGNSITPLQPVAMLLQAKPVEQVSEWGNVVFQQELRASGNSDPINDIYYQINPCSNLLKSGIEDSFTFFNSSNKNSFDFPTTSDFVVLTAKDNLKNVKINISELVVKFSINTFAGGFGFVDMELQIRHGLDYATATNKILLQTHKIPSESYYFNGNFEYIINELLRGESVWINFVINIRQTTGILLSAITCDFQIPTMKTIITCGSTSYNSTPITFRLIDVMKQIAKSTSNLSVYAPRYDVGGQFYDTVLTNGKLLSGNANDPFYVA